MLVSVAIAAALTYSLAASAVSTTITASSLKRASQPLLQWTPSSTLPQTMPAFQTKIDWDLDNLVESGYWYGTNGQQFGEILRANDDGIVTPGPTPGTDYLELLITYALKLDDGHWAYVRHTGGAIVRQYQNGIFRVETDSPKYSWLNKVDFIAPGAFNGIEVMTVNHYFPNKTG
ncbi:Outer membrane protein [Diaporthe eres]|nr:Outer membrane protein [Diaporthe eres]